MLINKYSMFGLILIVVATFMFFSPIQLIGSFNSNRPYISINFGNPVAYVKIAVNGKVVDDENIGINFIANRAVNIIVGDIVEVWFKWKEGFGGYIKLKINKLPYNASEPGCISVIDTAGNGYPGITSDVWLYIYNTWYDKEGKHTAQSSIVRIDLPDPQIYPTTTVTPIPTTTITPIPTTTTTPSTTTTVTTITSTTTSVSGTITSTSTTSYTITTTITYTGTATITYTTTTSESITTIYTTTNYAKVTTIQSSIVARNILVSGIIGALGITMIIFGFRQRL